VNLGHADKICHMVAANAAAGKSSGKSSGKGCSSAPASGPPRSWGQGSGAAPQASGGNSSSWSTTPSSWSNNDPWGQWKSAAAANSSSNNWSARTTWSGDSTKSGWNSSSTDSSWSTSNGGSWSSSGPNWSDSKQGRASSKEACETYYDTGRPQAPWNNDSAPRSSVVPPQAPWNNDSAPRPSVVPPQQEATQADPPAFLDMRGNFDSAAIDRIRALPSLANAAVWLDPDRLSLDIFDKLLQVCHWHRPRPPVRIVLESRTREIIDVVAQARQRGLSTLEFQWSAGNTDCDDVSGYDVDVVLITMPFRGE